ncbi:MAG TPA: ABC transporter substrate-binding protein, partial [Geminicoccaceae bacterium]|nr:ABC transporter substrate-binding protein [Geminicoccaceae bacterium]
AGTVCAGLALLSGAAAAADHGPGVTDTEIKIGNTNPYSGPASAYGTIGRSLAAYFAKVNDEGGINGRKINFISLDDGYSPPRTVEQIRKLVEQEQVLLIFQSLGTPTNSAVHQYLNAKKVPQLFVATGATKWGQPKKFPWTIGWQPNYQSEARIYAKYILDHKPEGKIGILYQNDDYGKDYLTGFKAGLGDQAAKMIVAEQSYEVTDPTVDSQIISLKNSGADIFFDITTPKFAAQAIRKAVDIGWKPLHFLNNVSNSVGSVLTPAGLDKSVGLITSLYQKDPTDPQWQDSPEYLEWVAWMDKYNPAGAKTDQFNVYGYNAAMTLVQLLKQCGDDLSRANVMRQAANLKNLELPMLLPGVVINTSPTDFYPIESMQLAKFDGEKWVLFGDVIDASQAR